LAFGVWRSAFSDFASAFETPKSFRRRQLISYTVLMGAGFVGQAGADWLLAILSLCVFLVFV
jgi:hypothetical protein